MVGASVTLQRTLTECELSGPQKDSQPQEKPVKGKGNPFPETLTNPVTPTSCKPFHVPQFLLKPVYRLGEVPVKEASVVIAISSPHRKDSLDAVSCAIDALKASVPIWKKEVYAGEYEPQWKANTECMWSNK